MNDPKLVRRGRIIEMRSRGLSPTEIANELGVSRETVYRWLQRWDGEGDIQDRPRSGAPKKTTEEEDKAIREATAVNHLKTCVGIKQDLQLDISTRTVRNRLHREGIQRSSPSATEKLTDRQREARLRFARQYVDQELDFWGRVIWSDEKTFSLTSHGQLYCWRRSNTRYGQSFYTLYCTVSDIFNLVTVYRY